MKESATRDGFIIYKSFYKPVSILTDEQLGRLFRAIFRWQIDGEVTADPDITVPFGFFVNQFRIDNDKYAAICEKNRANINKRWNTTEYDRIRNDTKHTDKDKDKEKDNDSYGGPGEAPARKKPFIKPSLDEVTAYCQDRNNGIDPGAFIDYYDANGWKIGKNPMRDWRAAIRTWERKHPNTATSTANTDRRKVITDPNDLFKI